MLAPVAEAGGLHGRDLQAAAQLVDDEGGERLSLNILSDDEQRHAGRHRRRRRRSTRIRCPAAAAWVAWAAWTTEVRPKKDKPRPGNLTEKTPCGRIVISPS